MRHCHRRSAISLIQPTATLFEAICPLIRVKLLSLLHRVGLKVDSESYRLLRRLSDSLNTGSARFEATALLCCASYSTGGTESRGFSNCVVLTHATDSCGACLTSSNERHGRSWWMTSVFNTPMTIPVSTKAEASPRQPTGPTIPAAVLGSA